MATIRADTYPGTLNSVEVRDADDPATVLETIVSAAITEVAGGVYSLTSVLTTGNWLLRLLDSSGNCQGVKYANPNYLAAADYPLWLNAVDFTEIEGPGFSSTDTLEEIRNAIDTIGADSGSETVVLIIKNTDGDPIPRASVYITSDITGSTLVTDGLLTNSEGKITTRLDPGTYYVWASKDDVAFSNPTSITVVDV